MGELSASSTHQVANNLNVILLEVATQVEGTEGRNTSKAKLNFNLSGEKNDSAQGKWADLNPFEALNGENESSNFLKKIPEELEGRWTFQGKKKQSKDRHNPPGGQPISSPYRTNKHSPKGEKRSDVLKTPPILLYLLRNPSVATLL
jgi:hypothetical protein